MVGGRINISFEADNDEEKKIIHSILQNKIQAEFEGSITYFSAGLKFRREKQFKLKFFKIIKWNRKPINKNGRRRLFIQR